MVFQGKTYTWKFFEFSQTNICTCIQWLSFLFASGSSWRSWHNSSHNTFHSTLVLHSVLATCFRESENTQTLTQLCYYVMTIFFFCSSLLNSQTNHRFAIIIKMHHSFNIVKLDNSLSCTLIHLVIEFKTSR